MIDLIMATVLIVLVVMVLNALFWYRKRTPRPAPIRSFRSELLGDSGTGTDGVFSVPTLDDTLDAVERDQEEFRAEQEARAIQDRRAARLKLLQWNPWSRHRRGTITWLKQQLEDALLDGARQRERAAFYQGHVYNHTTPSVKACRAADYAAHGDVPPSYDEGIDQPVSAKNHWRSGRYPNM